MLEIRRFARMQRSCETSPVFLRQSARLEPSDADEKSRVMGMESPQCESMEKAEKA